MIRSFWRPVMKRSPSRAVAEVAGIHPAVVQRRARSPRACGSIPAVTEGPRNSTRPSIRSADGPAAAIDDAHVVAGQRAPAGDEDQRAASPAEAGSARRVALKRLARHAVDAGGAAGRRHREAHRRLGEPVDRAHRLAPESVRREAPSEALDRFRAHGLRAVQGESPRAEIEALDLVVGDLAHAELEGEVRRRRDRGAMRVEGPQPARGSCEKRERRQDGDRHAESRASRATIPISPMS